MDRQNSLRDSKMADPSDTPNRDSSLPKESVWDYPRPPRLERAKVHLQIVFADEILADTQDGYRVLETSHPPVYYFPPSAVMQEHLVESDRRSFCEWKGLAQYLTVQVGSQTATNAAWRYPNPTPGFESIKDYIAFYPGMMDRCLVNGEVVTPQPGGFYGGWVTKNLIGPFKGAPGSMGW